jgi:hypothetical protein
MNTRIVDSIQPKLIESYLLHQEGILDASVWFDGENLRAQVTVPQTSNLTEIALMTRCSDALGVENTPERILVLTARGKAVVRAA